MANQLELFDGFFSLLKKEKKYCRTCAHRIRCGVYYSDSVIQCCKLQPSKRSNSGYKTIKCKDLACEYYEERKEEKKEDKQ